MAPLNSKGSVRSLAHRRKLALSAAAIGAAGLGTLLASSLLSSSSPGGGMEFDPERDLALSSDVEVASLSSLSVSGGSSGSRALANTVPDYDTDITHPIPLWYGNVAYVWDTFTENDQAMMWYVPRAGGNTFQKIMTHCLDFASANSLPGQLEGGLVPSTFLKINTLSDGGRYANLDMSDPSSYASAESWGLVTSGQVDVITTQRIKETAGLFKPDHRGRIFAMLRHPVKRAVDLFFYRQRATFDRDFDREVALMMLEEYAVSGHHVENFMVRTLLDKHGYDLTPDDVETAKNILREKVIVGIAEPKWFDASVVRFEKVFGWWETYGVMSNKTVNHCHHKMIKTGGHFGSHPKSKHTSAVFKLLANRNWADMELYSYAKKLFKRQAVFA